MNQANFEQLEKRVDELIDTCRRLKQENQGLRTHEADLADANRRMQEKMRLARERIEAMIGRLKTLERSG